MRTIRFQIFRKTQGKGGCYESSDIWVSADGLVHPDGMGPVTMDEFIESFRQRKYTTKLQAGDRLVVLFFGVIEIARAEHWRILPEEFLKELEDALDFLNDRPSSVQVFIGAFRDALEQPSARHRRTLATAYERVPLHRKRWLLGSIDRGDGEIRRLFSNECSVDEIQALREDPDLAYIWNDGSDEAWRMFDVVSLPGTSDERNVQ